MFACKRSSTGDVYRLYGLTQDDLCSYQRELPRDFVLGERAFEIVMAGEMAAGELETAWFERHGSRHH